MAEFHLPIEASFQIALFNQVDRLLSGEQAIDLLKSLHQQTVVREAMMKWLMPGARMPGLEHISDIIPRSFDCGDGDRP